VKSYGTADNPFPELPPAASLYSVAWAAGGAIFISRADPYMPLLLSSKCPALLTSQGSWMSWYYGTPGIIVRDGTYGISETGMSFDFEISSGYAAPYWDDGLQGGEDAIFSRIAYSDAENVLHWTPRPVDSWTIVHRVEFDPYDFVVMSDVGLLPFEMWHCVMMSWVVGGAKSIVYDDTIKSVGFEPDGWTGTWDGSYQDDSGAIPEAPERLALMSGEGGHYDWWLSTEFIDFNKIENRRRFITADLKPVSLGTDGAKGSPTGRKPEFFFHPGTTLADFTKNRGTGGDVRWTDQAGVNDGYFIDPVWKKINKPMTAGTGVP